MVKDIVVVADLGAAGNLVRNLLLLSEQTDWPLPTDRFSTISNQYQNVVLDNWLDIEYKLRFWKEHYNVDLSDNIDILLFNERVIKSAPVVYLNHSAFYQTAQYQQLKELVTSVYVAPVTEFGLRWQIRSYCEKKTVDKMHNFTFETDIEQQKIQYCNEHGTDAYNKLNIRNFLEIVNTRQKEFGQPNVELELLLSGTAKQVVDAIYCCTNIKINETQVDQILTKWRSCHWPLDKTNEWTYYDNNA